MLNATAASTFFAGLCFTILNVESSRAGLIAALRTCWRKTGSPLWAMPHWTIA
jgi:hypothetical protein